MAVPEPLRVQNENVAKRPRTRRASLDTQPIRLHKTQEERNAEMLAVVETDMATYLRGGEIPHADVEQVVEEPLRKGTWEIMHDLGHVYPMDEIPYEDRTGIAYVVLTGAKDTNGDTPAVIGTTVALPHETLGIRTLFYRKMSGE